MAQAESIALDPRLSQLEDLAAHYREARVTFEAFVDRLVRFALPGPPIINVDVWPGPHERPYADPHCYAIRLWLLDNSAPKVPFDSWSCPLFGPLGVHYIPDSLILD